MNIDSHLSPFYPKKIIDFRGTPIIFPRNLAFTGEAIEGGACGYGKSTHQGALGEFIERRHFYTDIPVDVVGKIHEHNTPEVANLLYKDINQLKRINKAPETQDFQLVKVHNIFTDEIAYFPRRFISLGEVSPEEENFIPMMDSSGLAVHNTKDKAFNASLNEFVERQALVGSWLNQSEIPQLDPLLLYELPESKRFCEVLMQNGTVSIFDLSSLLPGKTIGICYFSKSKQDRVQYAIGMASSQSYKAALSSAIQEVWQDYIFLHSYALDDFSKKVPTFFAGDDYHMSHLKDNTLETKKTIEFFKRASKTVSTVDVNDCIDLKDQLKALEQCNPNIFAYQDDTNQDNLYFTKILSPCFYLHMSLHKPLNFDNDYAVSIGANTSTKKHPRIPFP